MTGKILTSDLIRDDLTRYLTKQIRLHDVYKNIPNDAWSKKLPWGDNVIETDPYAFFMAHCNTLKKNPEFVTMVNYVILLVDKRRAGFSADISEHMPDRLSTTGIDTAINHYLLRDDKKRIDFIFKLTPHQLSKHVIGHDNLSVAQSFVDACDRFMSQLAIDVGDQTSDYFHEVIGNAVKLKSDMINKMAKSNFPLVPKTLQDENARKAIQAEHLKTLQSLPRFKIKRSGP